MPREMADLFTAWPFLQGALVSGALQPGAWERRVGARESRGEERAWTAEVELLLAATVMTHASKATSVLPGAWTC